MAEREIDAKGGLREGEIYATLTVGDATLALTYKRNDEQASRDMIFLIESCEDAFAEVLQVVAAAAKAKEKEQQS